MTDAESGAGSDDPFPELDIPGEDDVLDPGFAETEDDPMPEPPHAVNWNLLTAAEAEHEWLELNGWVNWLRRTYGLPAAIVPPLWHRHPELVWELSALHTHWLGAYHPEQNGSAPVGWHADFALARDRLREWTTIAGTKLDRDRPTRQTIWPGEPVEPATGETPVTDRDSDFVQFVLDDVERRDSADFSFAPAGRVSEV